MAALAAFDVAWMALARDDDGEARAFQAAVGGIGLGRAVSGAWSFHEFDSRVEATCENELTPIPGLACPNPYLGAHARPRRGLADD